MNNKIKIIILKNMRLKMNVLLNKCLILIKFINNYHHFSK